MLIVHTSQKIAQTNIIDELKGGVDYGDTEGDQPLPWEDFIEDNIEEQEQEYRGEESPDQEFEEYPQEEQIGGYQPGDVDVLNGEELKIQKFFENPIDLIRQSMLNNVIKIDYTTRFGVFISDRVVEPHRVFTAGTGNQILLTHDRTAGDIRGFIISQIHPGGVLYENSFNVKPEILRSRPKTKPIIKGKSPKKIINK